MIQAAATNGKRCEEVDEAHPLTATPKELPDQLSNACANVMEAANAQLAICELKATRMAVRVALDILVLAAMAIVAGYGFFLLDGCLANALSVSSLPAWFAPLTRGLLYTLAPAGVFFYIWWTRVGFGEKKPA